MTDWKTIVSPGVPGPEPRVPWSWRLLALLLVCMAGPQVAEASTFHSLRASELLDLVQRRTLRTFWEGAHPVSGMARERSSRPDTVTTGGTGFGVMALLVGAERGFLPREAVRQRVQQIVSFLASADRFHGAWPHWLDGRTGRVRPFSSRDDGADLVESAFLLQGLLTAREYFQGSDPGERRLRNEIDRLYREVDWTWFTRGGESVLYWHWSPNHGWAMNHPLKGYHEGLITYVLAAGSPTHPIAPETYHKGWARGSQFRNGQSYHGIRLPLGPSHGGPLFLSQYSFLGLDPRGLRDRYADYWEQNAAHTRINWAHCVRNPENHPGYSSRCWGLTASDTPEGYAAHSPTEDRGVITPTAALSAFPFTPLLSWGALWDFLHRDQGRLFGTTGFVDAFHPGTGWRAEDQLAIDQGPIVVMIENYRSGLLWRHFMRAPEVRSGLVRLDFSSPFLPLPPSRETRGRP